jgi:hypothetical protein
MTDAPSREGVFFYADDRCMFPDFLTRLTGNFPL